VVQRGRTVLACAEAQHGRPLNWVVRRHSVLFNIHGRLKLEILREDGGWVAYRIEPGKRMKWPELAIPASLSAAELPEYLDDLYHEMARPEQSVRQIDEVPKGK
jgi:hypothetical protein